MAVGVGPFGLLDFGRDLHEECSAELPLSCRPVPHPRVRWSSASPQSHQTNQQILSETRPRKAPWRVRRNAPNGCRPASPSVADPHEAQQAAILQRIIRSSGRLQDRLGKLNAMLAPLTTMHKLDDVHGVWTTFVTKSGHPVPGSGETARPRAAAAVPSSKASSSTAAASSRGRGGRTAVNKRAREASSWK
jgi:hypothetical protein